MLKAIAPPAAEVSGGRILSLKDVRQSFGLGVAAIREARRAGLPVRKIGRKSFILADELAEHIRAHGKLVR